MQQPPDIGMKPLQIAALFAGPSEDGGFMQSGFNALHAVARQPDFAFRFIDNVTPRFETLRDALRMLARSEPDLVVAHGGQNNDAALAVAAEHPAVMFAVTQGQVFGPNLASYDVMQEHSAFLAGMLAALTTKSGIVAHLSGIRVRPGLKGRAAYAAGVAFVDPDIRLLTCFCGHQDDPAIAEAAARQLIAAGADRLFTMLNSGRSGAISACRDLDCAQIGNVDDWTLREPDVFIGSAIADVGWGVRSAILDVRTGAFPAGQMRHIGLEQPSAVRLAIRADVAETVRKRIADAAAAIRAGTLSVPTEWQGQEISP